MGYILVTGAASGIGRMITETMSRRGWIVFACDINKNIINSYKNKNIIPVYMDVTNEKSINDAYREVAKNTLYLDIIINCAGIGLISSLIEEDLKLVQNVINVNLLGMIRVNKILFPILNKPEGRIINISSECGWMSAAPFNGPYSISKYGVEAYNDSLRRELMLMGMKVIKIQPGSFKTNMHKKTVESYKMLVESTKYFKPELSGMAKMLKRSLANPNDPKYIIDAVIKACESKKPKICYRVKNDIGRTIIDLLPEKLIDKLYKNVLDK